MGPGRHCRGCGRLANPIFISSYIISDVFSLGNIEIVVLMPKRYTFGALAARTRRVHGAQQARKRCEIGTLTARLQSPPKSSKSASFAMWNTGVFAVLSVTSLLLTMNILAHQASSTRLNFLGGSTLNCVTLLLPIYSPAATVRQASAATSIPARGPYLEMESSGLLCPNRLTVHLSTPAHS